jgi:hypothetical protein
VILIGLVVGAVLGCVLAYARRERIHKVAWPGVVSVAAGLAFILLIGLVLILNQDWPARLLGAMWLGFWASVTVAVRVIRPSQSN